VGLPLSEQGVLALAARMPAGELTPREPAFRIHQRFGHELPLAAERHSPNWTTTTTFSNMATEHRHRSTPMSRPKLFAWHSILVLQPNHASIDLK
jgi:hypothetical protein